MDFYRKICNAAQKWAGIALFQTIRLNKTFEMIIASVKEVPILTMVDIFWHNLPTRTLDEMHSNQIIEEETTRKRQFEDWSHKESVHNGKFICVPFWKCF